VDFLSILAPALDDLDDRVCSQAALTLAMRGSFLSLRQMREYEAMHESDKDDLALSLALLGSYCSKPTEWEAHRGLHHRYVFWIIANRPRSKMGQQPLARLHPSQDGEAYEVAKKEWLRLTQEYPNDPAIIRNAAYFLVNSDRCSAESLLKKGRQLEPGNQEWSKQLEFLNSLGGSPELQKEEQLVETETGDAGRCFIRGMAHVNKGNYEAAVEDFAEAVRLNPEHAKAYAARAHAFLHYGEPEKALPDLATAIQLDSEIPEFYMSRALVYRILGDQTNAKADERRARELAKKR
jgi:Flp pilus assembly protein TadD